MVLSSQVSGSLLSGPLTPKYSSKKAKFPISRFNVKNGVSSGHIANPLLPVKAKSVLSTNLHHSKNNFDKELNNIEQISIKNNFSKYIVYQDIKFSLKKINNYVWKLWQDPHN